MLLNAPPELPPLGVVLAGGPGKRMGGNKPMRLLAGRRLIDLALANLGGLCAQTMVVAGEVAAFADLPATVVADRWPGQGPLAALATALLESRAESLLVIPVDLPLVRPALLRLLIDSVGLAPAAAASNDFGLAPLPGLYRRACLPAALRLLEQGERRLSVLLRLVGGARVSREAALMADPDDFSFFNVNYPEDLAEAERLVFARGLIDTPSFASV